MEAVIIMSLRELPVLKQAHSKCTDFYLPHSDGPFLDLICSEADHILE